ncbi:hypothetical protein ZIOFF_014219 [Zingiber officinale]|uniref:Uncharacterized protein n=1 Tax=Zingiber officinale TaxID=94328 RepID=A0A8J5HVV6_ZINOF|nr:hypothetical protein ZIOFF_014219 [Zingiber officinale]
MATMMTIKVAEKLERMLAEEARLLAGVEDDVRDIVAELKSFTSFLTDMSTRWNLDDRQQNWVQEVREVAYDAEDLIDEFDSPWHSNLKKLKAQVEEIRKRNDRYSHPNEAFTNSGSTTRLDMSYSYTYTDPRIISHFVEEDQLVGIEQSRDTLIEWVMDENCLELTVISLIGSGGLGKTTLAKIVYDKTAIIGGHFQYRAWIAVSQNYNIKELLKKIIRQISVKEEQISLGCQDSSLNTEQLLNMMDDSQLVQIVRGHLNKKRYLLVFDDVWRTGAWESLNIALPPGKEGSRVIVTTRIEELSSRARRVFEAPDYNCPPELENVGREILQKCNGLPLAILTIGGLLASKPDKKLEEWKDLRDHLRLKIETNDMLLKIHQILVLSYNDLPCHLKTCFLFLGIFPEDFEIRRKGLMRRWIAEGIVSGEGGLPAEKVAERYFNQLVSRSLVQPSQFNDSGTVKSCRVHDMMLDVILTNLDISKKENFPVLLKEQAPRHKKIRRLSWHGESSELVADTDLSHLRSFTAFGEDVPLKDYRKQRLLRAIDLQGSWNNLFHLHHKSFSKLFLLKGTEIVKLPNTIVKLQKLVHLLAGSHILKVPKGIRKLKRLVTFGMVYADNVQPLQEIGELVDLHKLGIRFCDYDLSLRMLEEISALLSKLTGSLRSLKILHLGNSSLKKALDEVALPPLLLCKIEIGCRLGELPPWFASLKHVVKITLWLTQLQLEALQVLRNLPALVNLELGGESFVYNGENLVFDREGFAQLKLLTIARHNVSFEVGAVRSLEILEIIYPRESVIGIEHLHGLKEVHISSSDKDINEMVKVIAANQSNRPKCFATLLPPIDI